MRIFNIPFQGEWAVGEDSKSCRKEIKCKEPFGSLATWPNTNSWSPVGKSSVVSSFYEDLYQYTYIPYFPLMLSRKVEELEYILQEKYDLMVPKGTDTMDLHTWAYKWESMKEYMRHVIAKSKHCLSSPLMVALVVFVLIAIHIFFLTVLS